MGQTHNLYINFCLFVSSTTVRNLACQLYLACQLNLAIRFLLEKKIEAHKCNEKGFYMHVKYIYN